MARRNEDWAVLLLGAAAALALGCQREGEYVRPLPPVRVRMVVAPGPAGAVRYSGRVAAETEVTLVFRVGGYVTAITQAKQPDGTQRLIQAGDSVRRSAVLASIRRSDYATKVSEVRGMHDDAKAAVAQAKLDLDRAKALRAQDVIAQSEYDAVKARYDALVGAAVAADARVGQARIALGDTELRSSLDGILLHRAIEIGDLVSPGTPAFVVADTSKVKIVFGVPDSVHKALKIGQPVAVHTEALPGRAFAGLVSKIAAKADDKSRAFDVEATVDNRDQALKVGFIATAELENTSAAAAGVVVPLSAIVPVPGRKDAFGVFVVQTKDEGSVATLRPVILGDLVRNDVSLIEGVGEGESVIVEGANVVRDGEKVAVIQ